MKKVLLATTALVLSAGFAAAEVKLSGSANMGLKYDEGGLSYAPAKKAAAWYEIDIDVVGTMESDSGLTFGASVDLDSDYKSALAGTAQTAIDGEVFVSGAFGTFTIGNVDPIADDYGLTDIGFDGIGIDDVAEDAGYTGSADARWDYTVGAMTLGVSVNTISEDYGVGAAYDAGMFMAALTFDHDEAGNNDTTSLLLGGKFDAFSAELYVTDNDTNDTSWGLYGAYTTGALTLEASYADADTAADAAYGIGAKYDLGGGAKLAGGLGSVSDDMVADFGVTFKF
ncbi:MAG: porin [Sphingomonadales bacterium]|nr:porin [Sphingomonadales bacterium]